MRRGAAIGVAVVCAAVLGLAALAGADPPTGTVTPYEIPALTEPSGVTGGPQDIATGSDGSLWFTESASNYEIGQLGTIAESGAVEEPTGATGLPGAQVIAQGTAGTMWFTQDDSVHTIGELAIATETVTPSPVLGEEKQDTYSYSYGFAGLAVDPLGDVWATVSGDWRSIVELSPPYDAWTQPSGPTGQTGPTGFDNLDNTDGVSVQPGSIVLGPDANMWFTENAPNEDGTDQIGTFSPTASPSPPTLYPATGSPALPPGRLGNIVVGPDGNLWVGLLYEPPVLALAAPLDAAVTRFSYVLRITPSGTITEYELPEEDSDADPDVLAVGPDGRLWMPDTPGTDDGLTAISTDGTFTNYPNLLPPGADITALVADPGGADALWLTDQAGNAIYRVALQPPATNAPPTTTTSTTSTTTTAVTTSPPATVLTVTLAAASTVTKSGATLTGTIVALPGPQTTATYEFQYGTSTAYGSQTAPATATATPAGASVSATLSALAPYTTYHYRLVASDCAAASCQVASPDQTFTTGSTLQPQLNATVGVTATEGQILIKLAGKHGFVRLQAGELLPLGATIDALHGTVLIQSATAPGAAEGASGLFSGGVFVVTQRPGSTVTVLGLASSFTSCPGRVMARLAAVESKKKKKKRAPASKKVVNEVFGNAHGHFSTRGHYATAADQGTRWSTADRCDGTLIAVTLGQVTVTDHLRHRTFVVRAGHHYLANHG
jgi:hypothetical protein